MSHCGVVAVLFFVIGLIYISAQSPSEICVGSICVTPGENQCSGDPTFEVRVSGIKVWQGQVQLNRNFCLPVPSSPGCQWCVNSTTTDSLFHYCFGTSNCVTDNSRCANVPKNNCNGVGTCTIANLCLCNPGYYGLDCSIGLQDSCILTSTETFCWKLDFPSCETIFFDLNSNVRGTLVRENLSISDSLTFPTQTIPYLGQECSMTVVVSDLEISKDKLLGTPSITLSGCSSEVLPLPRTTIVRSPKLLNCSAPVVISPSAPAVATNSTSLLGSGTGKTILLILTCVIGLLFLGGAGYFFVTKYFGQEFPNPFSEVDVFMEDEAPLKSSVQYDD